MVPQTAARRAASSSEITRTSIGTPRPSSARRSRTDSRTQSSTDGSITRRSTSEPGRYPWRAREPKSTIFERAGTSSARRRPISSIRTSSPTGRQYRSTEPVGGQRQIIRRNRIGPKAITSSTRSWWLRLSGSSSALRCRRHRNRDCFAPASLTFRCRALGAARRLQSPALRLALDSIRSVGPAAVITPAVCALSALSRARRKLRDMSALKPNQVFGDGGSWLAPTRSASRSLRV
jgi:hypothetical protein